MCMDIFDRENLPISPLSGEQVTYYYSSACRPWLTRYLCHLYLGISGAALLMFKSCTEFYEPMCEVNSMYEQWRQVMCSKRKH